MKTPVFLWLLLSFLSIFGKTDNPSENQFGGVLYEYPYINSLPSEQSPVPEGYEPFHLEHYGRHGSRNMLSKEDYDIPVQNLEKAEKAGKLTPLGHKTLDYLRKLQKGSRDKLGELTPKGALQHRVIGNRMARNFPQIFTPGADLSAVSTIVNRCIMSMNNSVAGINEVVPGLEFITDSSKDNMWFMNFKDEEALNIRARVNTLVLDKYRDSLMRESAFLSRLVTDPEFAGKHVSPGLLPRLYWALSSTQNNDDNPLMLEEVFGHDDLLMNWNYGNARRFLLGGNSKLTNNRMPFSQRHLLRQIINHTDSAIAKGTPGANLRYGHDDVLMPLLVLMELDNFGIEINSFEELETSGWHDYDITPMAGNLQLVFYRPIGKYAPEEILVKAMINECEASMPGSPVDGPYYKWEEIKKYYLKKLEKSGLD